MIVPDGMLKKFSSKRPSTAGFMTYSPTALSVSGPWLFTILCVSGLTLVASREGASDALKEFRLLLLYHFCFSLILSAPFFSIATLCLADRVCSGKTPNIPGLFLCSLASILVFFIVPVVGFYGVGTHLDTLTRIAASIHACTSLAVWLTVLFLSMLKKYRTLVWGILIGGSGGLVASWSLLPSLGTAGLLLGFSFGLCMTLVILLSSLLDEPQDGFENPFQDLLSVKDYWKWAVSALFYATALWIDKGLMWTNPEAQHGKSGLSFFTLYESPFFLAQLTGLPGMILFFVQVEPKFFQKCRKFYADITNKATYAQIQENHRDLLETLSKRGRTLFSVQAGITAFFIFMTPFFFDRFSLNPLQKGIFSLSCLGVFFQNHILFIGVLLTYFNAQKEVLLTSSFFLVSHGVLTLLSLSSGFRFYGYGYFLSCLFTFGLALTFLRNVVLSLPYRSFMHQTIPLQSQLCTTASTNRLKG